MVQQSKQDYLAAILGRYLRAGREYKRKILDEFCEICGYHRNSWRSYPETRAEDLETNRIQYPQEVVASWSVETK
jgi:hypothetical protein